MDLTGRLLEQTLVYRIWMAPQAEQKFAPIRANNDLSQVRRVLDVGCGPGTNTRHFPGTSYLGLDINERYIENARRRFPGDFRAVDVTTYQVAHNKRYDFVLVNSFLHHLPTPDVRRILAHLNTLLSPDGCVHILELLLPEERSLALALARLDRGKYARSQSEWQQLFTEAFEQIVLEPYRVGVPGLTLWNMLYFKGRAGPLHEQQGAGDG